MDNHILSASDFENCDPNLTTKTLTLDEKQYYAEDGNKLYAIGRYSQAMKIYEKILEKGVSLPKDLITIYRKLGLCSLKVAKYSDSYDFYMKAMEANKYLSDDDAFMTAAIAVDIAEVLFAQGKYLPAEEKLQQALNPLLEISESASNEVAKCYNVLAEVNGIQGKYKIAFEYLEKATQVVIVNNSKTIHDDINDKETKEKSNLILATSYYHMGNMHRHLGDFTRALEYLDKSLKIREGIYGKSHPEVILCYNMIGYIWVYQGKYHEAKENINKALKIALEFLGPSHPVVATSYTNFGAIYFDLGEHQKSLEYSQKALNIRLPCLGETHLDVANTYNDIANIYYYYLGQFSKALEFYQKALEIRLQIHSEDHPAIGDIFQNIGSVYKEQGKFKIAEEYFLKAYERRIKNFGPKNPRIATSYECLGVLYHGQKIYDKALPNYINTIRIRSSIIKDQPLGMASCLFNLSCLFENVLNTESSETFSLKANKIHRKIFDENNQRVRKSKNQLLRIQKKKSELDINNNLNP